MLVCSANWLLNDGSVSRPPAVRDVRALIRWLKAVAARAGFRSDGRYQPVERVDLVLAGDTLDMLTSTRWHGSVRPWHTTETANQRRRTIAHESMWRGRRVVAALRQLHQRGLSVPSPTPLMRPSTTCQSHVPVRIAILAGDRDRWILSFGKFPSQLPVVPAAWAQWGEDEEVLIAHGHDLDPAAACSMINEPRPPSVAESLAVDLVVPFLSQLRRKKLLNANSTVSRDLAAVHPLALLTAVSRCFTCRLESCAGHPQLMDVWKRTVAAWHRAARRDPPAVVDVSTTIVDLLAGWLDDWSPARKPQAAPLELSELLQIAKQPLPEGWFGSPARTAVFGHLPATLGDLHVSRQQPHQQARIRGADGRTVLGLSSACPEPSRYEFSWAAIFEKGEHAGSHSMVFAAGSPVDSERAAPAIVGGPKCPDVVDAMRAA
jgi:transposase